MFFNKKNNNSRDINVLPKDTKNTYYYMLKSYIDIIDHSLSTHTKYNEKNIYKYKCIISSYLNELKIIYNVNSIKIFIKKYKPNGEQFSILDMLNYLIKTYDNEYAKKIKSEFSDLTKTKKRRLKRSKKTYKRN
jgi:hypothetical protein